MDWLQAIIMGLVQGLTEFLPVSSSAHLRVVGELIGAGDPGAGFTAITQIGTETAVLIFFWKDIVRIVKSWWYSLPFIGGENRVPSSNPDARLGWMIIVGSIPIAVLGLLLEDWIDTTFRNLWITVVMLIVFGLLLGYADRIGKRVNTLDNMKWGQAIGFGFAQALALIPGVSRSGGTITAGRLMGFTREAAARYSFLLALPAVFASGFYKMFKSLGDETSVAAGPTIVATAVAFAVGYMVIVWFLKLVTTKSFEPFVIYRIAFAIVVAVLLIVGVLQPLSVTVV
ncbi:undecaprenyl-diphosphate phosphatase [Actinomyces minihominis]|uniref:undecaprenyl-diphosphate phosphatase n=1 Tax=Actinomyces minihominis TaxID=2002838 RepID=UPI000C085E2D|nr:undecaprenyl-diphosphate phosphatase [Actinomyces minihominis]